MVSVWFILVAFLLGAGVTGGSAYLASQLFIPKTPKKELARIRKQENEEEAAWSEGFDSVSAHKAWLKEKGGSV
jgi:hypothetical protein